MKRSIIGVCIFSFLVNVLMAQFTLSGKMKHYKNGYRAELNVPFIYSYSKENNIPFDVDSAGNFKVFTNNKEQKFVTLQLGYHSQTLLFTTGKNLILEVDCATDSILTFNGSSANENQLLYSTHVAGIPFFAASDDVNNIYAKMSMDSLKDQLIQPWMMEENRRLAMVKQAGISARDKLLIQAEITYDYYNQLSSFARIIMYRSDRSRINTFIMYVFDNISSKPLVFPAGPQYYFFVESYMNYLETKAFTKKMNENLKDDAVLDYFNINLDSANKVVADKGKRYIYWMLCRNNFEPAVAENYLAQVICNQYVDKDLKQVRSLVSAFNTSFPHSRYVNDMNAKQATLESLLAKNNNNEAIKIVENYKNVQSIYEVVNKLKGKVVYLDVWGTWCGPCKHELKYNPAMKNYFKGKDVEYVYLDMDEDNADSAWKNFVKVNEMTGVHLRKTRKEIEAFWEELYAGEKGKERFYPSYFIFDKTGKLVVSQANRPSDTTALYAQIEAVLKQ